MESERDEPTVLVGSGDPSKPRSNEGEESASAMSTAESRAKVGDHKGT